MLHLGAHYDKQGGQGIKDPDFFKTTLVEMEHDQDSTTG